jgi:hypothetical protein
MKKVTIAVANALALAALLVSVAAASPLDALKGTTPQERAAIQNKMMAEKLALTPQQQPQIDALNLKYAQKMQSVIDGDEGMFAKMRAAQSVDQEKEAELQKILTPDQWSTYLAGKEEMREKLQAAFAKRAADGTP